MKLRVNGVEHEVAAAPDTLLPWVLRDLARRAHRPAGA
jgi:aerobic-type carbon monoxide dehydrogenase small subunit (CoxS/CutS family)